MAYLKLLSSNTKENIRKHRKAFYLQQSDVFKRNVKIPCRKLFEDENKPKH